MRVYPFRAAHLDNLLLQPAQEFLRDWMQANQGIGKAYESGYAFSLLDDEAETLACAGLIEVWPGRASAWALMSANLGGAGMLRVVKAIRREFELQKYERIEAYVDHDFEQGHRLMRLLGFTNETPNGMRKFTLGRTNDLYARVL